METVGNFGDLAAARVAQSALESAGIHAEIPDQFFAGIDWQMGTALRGVRLVVAPEDADAALQILSESEIVIEGDSELEEASACCSACGSEHVGPARWRRRVKALALIFPPLLLLYPLLALRFRRFECYRCGGRWNEMH